MQLVSPELEKQVVATLLHNFDLYQIRSFKKEWLAFPDAVWWLQVLQAKHQVKELLSLWDITTQISELNENPKLIDTLNLKEMLTLLKVEPRHILEGAEPITNTLEFARALQQLDYYSKVRKLTLWCEDLLKTIKGTESFDYAAALIDFTSNFEFKVSDAYTCRWIQVHFDTIYHYIYQINAQELLESYWWQTHQPKNAWLWSSKFADLPPPTNLLELFENFQLKQLPQAAKYNPSL